MVRIPAGWRGAIAARTAGSGRGGWIAATRIRVDTMQGYDRQVTVDLGNDGVANSVLFNSGGDAWAFCGPYGTGQSWALDQCYLSTSIGQLDPSQATVYVGPYMQPYDPVAQYGVTGSPVGGNTQFGMGGLALATGWFVTAFWTGGTPGAVAYLRVTGTKTALSR